MDVNTMKVFKLYFMIYEKRFHLA